MIHDITSGSKNVQDHVLHMAGAMDTLDPTSPRISTYHFIAKHGIVFPKIEQDSRVNMGRMKECFRNAAHVALARESFTYCEGYAIGSVFPVLHAWVVDRAGVVHDPTWAPPGIGYVGVAIRKQALFRHLQKTKVYGMLDCLEDKFRIIRMNESELWRSTFAKIPLKREPSPQTI